LDIFGTTNKTVPLDILFKSEISKNSSLDVSIEVFQKQLAYCDMFINIPLPYRYMRLRKDLITRYFGGTASDVNFFEGFDPPNPGAIVTNGIGSFDPGHRSLIYSVSNDLPTNVSFDKYSLPLAAPVVLSTIGFRILTHFKISSIGPNSILMFGAFNDQLDPFSSISSTDICAFAMEAVYGGIKFRGWYGNSVSPSTLSTILPSSYFLSKPLCVEIEQISTSPNTVEFRLFDCTEDLDTPLISFQVSTGLNPTVDRFSITSLGRRSVGDPTSQPNMSVNFEYVDIEPGTGVLYFVPPTGLTALDAKWRPYQDRPPIQLRAFGDNQVFCSLSSDGISSTIEAQDIIKADQNRPDIFVTKLEIDSPVFVPYSVTPPIPKVSKNLGFSGISLTWFATQPGTWSLRLNSKSVSDGTELVSGIYVTPGLYQITNFDFSSLVYTSGTFDITLYLTNEAGLSAGKGIGTYLLPYQPVIGAALDVSFVSGIYGYKY
jgi:hypothetical protein